jgi:hypothetical protein
LSESLFRPTRIRIVAGSVQRQGQSLADESLQTGCGGLRVRIPSAPPTIVEIYLRFQ